MIGRMPPYMCQCALMSRGLYAGSFESKGHFLPPGLFFGCDVCDQISANSVNASPIELIVQPTYLYFVFCARLCREVKDVQSEKNRVYTEKVVDKKQKKKIPFFRIAISIFKRLLTFEPSLIYLFFFPDKHDNGKENSIFASAS